MFVRDIWFAFRLVTGRMHKNRAAHDLAGLSPAFQPVAGRLLTALPQDHQPIWEEFLAGLVRPDPTAEVALEPGLPAAATLAESLAPAPARADGTPQWGPRRPVRGAPRANLVKPRGQANLTCAVAMEQCAVDWLWAGRVPLGMITMFAGDPKLGKSLVSLAMAAALSRGLPLPMSDRPDRVGSTILMSAEDDSLRTIAPRLAAAGADLTKIHILKSITRADGSAAFPSLRADIDAITVAAAGLGDCRLIVIDPVSAYLGGVDDNRNAALRGVLTPLNGLAERLGAAVVLVSHLSKTGSANGRHRVLGSIAYVGACRANHLFVADPDDQEGRRVLMIDNGGNVAPPAPPLAYVIENRGSGPRVEWSAEAVAIAAANALKPAGPARPCDEAQAVRHNECDRWLRALLADGPRPARDIFQAAKLAGFSKKQLRRSKSRNGVTAVKKGFANEGQWSWML